MLVVSLDVNPKLLLVSSILELLFVCACLVCWIDLSAISALPCSGLRVQMRADRFVLVAVKSSSTEFLHLLFLRIRESRKSHLHLLKNPILTLRFRRRTRWCCSCTPKTCLHLWRCCGTRTRGICCMQRKKLRMDDLLVTKRQTTTPNSRPTRHWPLLPSMQPSWTPS